MDLVQKMKKSSIMRTVTDFSKSFNDGLTSMKREFDEIIVVFDTYTMPGVGLMVMVVGLGS